MSSEEKGTPRIGIRELYLIVALNETLHLISHRDSMPNHYSRLIEHKEKVDHLGIYVCAEG